MEKHPRIMKPHFDEDEAKEAPTALAYRNGAQCPRVRIRKSCGATKEMLRCRGFKLHRRPLWQMRWGSAPRRCVGPFLYFRGDGQCR